MEAATQDGPIRRKALDYVEVFVRNMLRARGRAFILQRWGVQVFLAVLASIALANANGVVALAEGAECALTSFHCILITVAHGQFMRQDEWLAGGSKRVTTIE
jgi:hypothetical protein